MDLTFGTGAVKITPAHDINDYKVGLKLGLPMISIFDKTAALNDNAPKDFVGLDRFVARERVWARLQEEGLADSVTEVTQRIPRSQRGGDIIEPRLSTQWFVKTNHMADAACKSVENGTLKIIPEQFEKVWFQWLKSPQDWCVSRQLWWGHRIPVYYIKQESVPFDKDIAPYVVARDFDDARQQASSMGFSSFELEQEEDVLDTWFR